MTVRADSRTPAVAALCLDWLHDTLPWPNAPHGQMNPSGFARPEGARSTRAWRQCEQCGGTGTTRRGPCGNCEGAGGWHYDPMDDRRAALRTSADAHPDLDRPVVRIVRVSSATTRETIEAELGAPLPPTLRTVTDTLDELRQRSRPHRAILQRVHVIRLDSYGHLREPERVLYDAALVHFTTLLPRGFRAPRWIREKAAGSLVRHG